MRRQRLACALALAGAAVLLAVPLASRAADDNQACSDGQGVTLVVDFQALPGGVNVRCASQPISNGYDVFRHTNPPVNYETVSGRDFVCRIAGVPEHADCSDYPPADAYWSYWWGVDGKWQYASKGAGAHHVPPGGYEGWSWVSTDHAYPPRYPVPPAPTTTTTTVTTPVDSPAPVVAVTTTRGRGSGGTAATTAPTTTTTTAAFFAVPVLTTTTAVALGHVDLSQGGKSGGTSRGFVLSGLAVVTLGAVALAFVRGRAR